MGWIDLFRELGIFALIIAGSSWVIRKYIEKLLDKDLEKFKAGLEKESIEFKIKYEKMHSERMEVIKEVYKKIVKTYKSFSLLICPLQLSGEPSLDEKGKEAALNINSLTDFFAENRIFFEEKLAEEIDSLLAEFRNSWNMFQYSQEVKNSNHKEALDEWNNAWKNIEKILPNIKKELGDKFREILGIKCEK